MRIEANGIWPLNRESRVGWIRVARQWTSRVGAGVANICGRDRSRRLVVDDNSRRPFADKQLQRTWPRWRVKLRVREACNKHEGETEKSFLVLHSSSFREPRVGPRPIHLSGFTSRSVRSLTFPTPRVAGTKKVSR